MNGMETVAPNLVVPNIRAARRMRPPPGVATRGEESDRFCPSGLFLLGQFPLTSLLSRAVTARSCASKDCILLCGDEGRDCDVDGAERTSVEGSRQCATDARPQCSRRFETASGFFFTGCAFHVFLHLSQFHSC